MPKTKEITVYSLEELKELFPSSYEKVHNKWVEYCELSTIP